MEIKNVKENDNINKEKIENDIEKLKDLITRHENLSLSETLELYKLRSYYFKNYGITSDDLIYISTDELVNRIVEINEKMKNNLTLKQSKKITLDDIFNEEIDDDLNDYRKILRKSLITKSIEIRRGGRDIKFILNENKFILHVPKNMEIAQEEIKNKEIKEETLEPEDIFDNLNTQNTKKENKKEEIIEVDNIPILKYTGKRYRVIRQDLNKINEETLSKIILKLKEKFKDKFLIYFMRIFNINSRKDAKNILKNIKENYEVS